MFVMKRTLISLLAFGVVFAAVAGFAASMNIGGTNLGAGTGSVAKCDDVTVAWGTPTWNGSAFEVGSVTIAEDNSDEGGTPVNSCTGHAVSVRVGAVSATGTLTGTPASASLSLSAPVAASSLTSVDVVVS
jgi:hypothetical protein